MGSGRFGSNTMQTAKNMKLTIIGGGTMGKSFALMLTKRFIAPSYLTVSDRDRASIEDLARDHGIAVTDNNPEAIKNARVILLAVKPVDICAVIEDIKTVVKPGTLFISIAAGVKIQNLRRILGKNAVIVRAMPNTPTRIAKGITVWTTNGKASKDQIDYTKALFSVLGEQYFTENESLLDKVTAVSGSGPAYYFYFTEALIHAALKLGFNEQLSYALATKTFYGTAALMEHSGKKPEDLRKAVTSKKGTTEAAIGQMKEDNLEKIVEKAVYAAFRRAQELGNAT